MKVKCGHSRIYQHETKTKRSAKITQRTEKTK